MAGLLNINNREEEDNNLSTQGWIQFKLETPFESLLGSYENLPADQYAPKSRRSRRFSQFKAIYNGKNWQFEKLPHRPFVQASVYNPLVGGVKREFEPLETAVTVMNLKPTRICILPKRHCEERSDAAI